MYVEQERLIKLLGRTLIVPLTVNGFARFEFADLCDQVLLYMDVCMLIARVASCSS